MLSKTLGCVASLATIACATALKSAQAEPEFNVAFAENGAVSAKLYVGKLDAAAPNFTIAILPIALSSKTSITTNEKTIASILSTLPNRTIIAISSEATSNPVEVNLNIRGADFTASVIELKLDFTLQGLPEPIATFAQSPAKQGSLGKATVPVIRQWNLNVALPREDLNPNVQPQKYSFRGRLLSLTSKETSSEKDPISIKLDNPGKKISDELFQWLQSAFSFAPVLVGIAVAGLTESKGTKTWRIIGVIASLFALIFFGYFYYVYGWLQVFTGVLTSAISLLTFIVGEGWSFIRDRRQGVVEGYVHVSNGENKLERVSITLRDEEDKIQAQTISGLEGRYELRVLISGKTKKDFKIVSKAADFLEQTDAIYLGRGEKVTHLISLTPLKFMGKWKYDGEATKTFIQTKISEEIKNDLEQKTVELVASELVSPYSIIVSLDIMQYGQTLETIEGSQPRGGRWSTDQNTQVAHLDRKSEILSRFSEMRVDNYALFLVDSSVLPAQPYALVFRKM